MVHNPSLPGGRRGRDEAKQRGGNPNVPLTKHCDEVLGFVAERYNFEPFFYPSISIGPNRDLGVKKTAPPKTPRGKKKACLQLPTFSDNNDFSETTILPREALTHCKQTIVAPQPRSFAR